MAKGVVVSGGGVAIEVSSVVLDRLYAIYTSGTDQVVEVNPTSFAILNTVNSPSSTPTGVGGMESRLYTCDTTSNRNYELNPNTLGVINNIVAPATDPWGIGGIKDRLYNGDRTNSKNYYELNPNTLGVINSLAAAGPAGIGGIEERLYSTTDDDNLIHELNPDTLASINSATANDSFPFGCGGIKSRLYSGGDNTSTIWERNIDTLDILATRFTSFNKGVGGIFPLVFTLTIEDLIEGLTSSDVVKIVYDSTDYIQ